MNYKNKYIFFEDEQKHLDPLFEARSKTFLYGPSGSGKTVMLYNILNNHKDYIKPNCEKIYFCYNNWQENYDKIKQSLPSVIFNEGLFDFSEINPNENALLIIDDLYLEAGKDQNLIELFIRNAHHNNITCFLVTQNLFSKDLRILRINSDYIIYLDCPADRTPIYKLSQQMFPSCSNCIVECFYHALAHGYDYLYIKTKPRFQKFRIQTGIFKNEQRKIYNQDFMNFTI